MADPFAQLARRAAAQLTSPPLVTAAAYAAITCNRCGQCCEDIRSPLAPPALAAAVADTALAPDRRRFLAGLVPVAPIAGGWRYRCQYFAREATGLGTCTVHATRPAVCRDYPYGGVVRQWVACAWYVRVQD